MEVTALLKKENPLKKENYQSVNLLFHKSTVLERIIWAQENTIQCIIEQGGILIVKWLGRVALEILK